jgi:acyl carrier protein
MKECLMTEESGLTPDPSMARIRRVVGQVLELEDEEFADETMFEAELGVESVQKLDLVVAIEEEFDIRLPGGAIPSLDSVTAVAAVLREHGASHTCD